MSNNCLNNKEQCIKYYKQAAMYYDKKRFDCQCERLIDEMFKEAVHELLKDCDYILDAGTGTGRFAIYLAKKGKKVVAVDSSEEMLTVAKEKASQEGVLDKITFQLGDIEHLPLADSSIDGICCIHVFVHYPNISNALHEFSRVLKKDGLLVFELANQGISLFYHKIWTLVTGRKHFSYPDCYHKNKAVIENLSRYGLKTIKKQRIKLFPGIILHFILCRGKQYWLIPIIKFLEKLNIGTVALIQAKKT